jgi:hypothetical protein
VCKEYSPTEEMDGGEKPSGVDEPAPSDGERKRPHSPDSPTDPGVAKRHETHPSVMTLSSDKDSAPGTPVSTKTNKTVSPSRLDLLADCVTNNTSRKENIDCNFLYDIIVGLEMRVFNQEKDVADLKEKHKLQIDELKQEIETLKQNTVDREFINHMKREIPRLSDDCSKNSTDIDVLKSKTPILNEQNVNGADAETQIQHLKTEVKRLNRSSHLVGEKHEQYSRRDSVVIKGVPYKHGENTNTIMCQIAYSLGVQVSASDISVSHRTGNRDTGGTRPILCKFTRRDIKHQLLMNKKLAARIRCDEDGNPVRIFVDED